MIRNVENSSRRTKGKNLMIRNVKENLTIRNVEENLKSSTSRTKEKNLVIRNVKENLTIRNVEENLKSSTGRTKEKNLVIRNVKENLTIRNVEENLKSSTGRTKEKNSPMRNSKRAPENTIVIEVKVRRLQVGFLRESRCEGAYVQFSDSVEELDDEAGRYCGHVSGNATRLLLRRGPDLIITMDSDVKFAAENPVIFSAQFSVLPARLAAERHRGFSQPSASECPLECTIRNDQRTCRLASPGYPGVYPRGIRCRIALESAAGRFEIGGQPEDLFNLMNYTSRDSCQTENCEDHVETETNSSKDRFEGHDEPFRARRTIETIESGRQDEIDDVQRKTASREIKRRPKNATEPGRHRGAGQEEISVNRTRSKSATMTSAKGDVLYKARNRSESGGLNVLRIDSGRGGLRVKRVSNRDEDDEFVIGQMSQDPKRSRGKHGRNKGPRFDSQGERSARKEGRSKGTTGVTSKRGGTFLGKGGQALFDGRFGSVQKRHRHAKRIRKKSMSVLPAGRRNFERDSQDADGLRWPNRDGASERSRKTFSHDVGSLVQVREHGYLKRYRFQEKLGGAACIGDYLALLENVNGKIFEISKFCGDGHVPRVMSRGKNVIVEFFAEKDGTMMHDGFQLTLRESGESGSRYDRSCEFVYKSSDRTRETVRSLQSWYPPNTVCTYKFLGKSTERISVHMKIIRNELEHEPLGQKRNFSLNYCPGNEIVVYNGAQANGSQLMWSYCDLSHRDINNIQVPLTSSGNELLIQYYSAKGSYDGEDFTYTISYRFVKRAQNSTIRRQVQEDLKLISLRPVNFSALNLNDSENCNCDFGDRIGSFKNWFMVLVVLGIVSFVGAVLTIIALLAKCLKLRSMEKKLLQTPKR